MISKMKRSISARRRGFWFTTKTGQHIYVEENETPKEACERVYKEKSEERKEKLDSTKSFATQVDAVLSGADTSTTHIRVMNTPKVLRELNVPDLPVIMTAKHIRSVALDDGKEKMNYHGLGAETVKRLPELLSDPVMVMQSRTKDDSIVVLTAELDKENRPIIAAVKLKGHGNIDDVEIEANVLTSVYGRNNFSSFLNNNVSEDRIMWWSKAKAEQTGLSDLRMLSQVKDLPPNTVLKKMP